jgi:NADH:ubiquinone oxidoreductase subunit 6 (subunit J)
MIVWIFVALALGGAAAAATVANMRTATLSFWIASLAVGGVYLTLGAETLAVIQWIVCTLAAISFIFFAAMFGEFDDATSEPRTKATPRTFDRGQVVALGLAALIGIAFVVVIRIGAADLTESSLVIPNQGNDLLALGHVLTTNHLLSLEVLGMTLLLILVGGGVIARPEPHDNEAESRPDPEARPPC